LVSAKRRKFSDDITDVISIGAISPVATMPTYTADGGSTLPFGAVPKSAEETNQPAVVISSLSLTEMRRDDIVGPSGAYNPPEVNNNCSAQPSITPKHQECIER